MSLMRCFVFSSVAGTAFFRRMLDEWQAAGVTVTRVEAVSQEGYRAAKGPLERMVLRWRMYGGMVWLAWRAARRGRTGGAINLVSTNPFYLPALVQRTTAGRNPTILLLYDLYPEALIEAGLLGRESWLARYCARITRYALRECAVTVFLGRRLQTYTEATYGPARLARIIPVGADGRPFRGHVPVAAVSGERPLILYCGQLGRMHDVDTVLGAWGTAAAERFIWRFQASGVGYAKVREAAQHSRSVVLGSPLDDEAWQQVMREAAIALVTIARGGEKVVMPSKTYSALVAGQAILAICVRDSDLADLVYEHDCGWVVEPGDTAGLVALLEHLASNPNEVLAKRRNAYRVGHEKYDMAPIARQWLTLFEELQPSNSPRCTQ
jgi:glycosyltransferase involved in cell wall biosynthesis